MPTDAEIDEVASILFAAALSYTNTIGRKGWSWEAADPETKRYWRNIARIAWNTFDEQVRAKRPKAC